MLCAKCQKEVATVYLTTIVEGFVQQKIDLCANCANMSGIGSPEGQLFEALEAISVTGKKCEFCGADAITGAFCESRGIFYCLNCSGELSQELMKRIRVEHPEWLSADPEAASLAFFATNKDFEKWGGEAFTEAVKVVREQHKNAD